MSPGVEDIAVELRGAVAVVTGAAGGIGRALVQQLLAAGAAVVVAADRDEAGLAGVATLGPTSTVVTRAVDVRAVGAVEELVRWVESEHGRIDVLCSNAGVMAPGGVDSPEEDWQASWEVNVLAHVRAARAALPGMLDRSRGAFLHVLSAAGMLCAPDSAPYTATKHAALGFAEWLAIDVGHRGIAVCAVCPEAVDTPMLRAEVARGAGDVVPAEEVAAAAVRGLAEGRFLVTTHPHTLRYVQGKWSDVDRWIGAMGAQPAGKG